MASNPINPLRQQLMSEENIRQISSMIGTDEPTAQRAVGAALPALLAALTREARTEPGAQALAGALDRDHDGSILNDITGYLSAGGNTTEGNAILGHILGSQTNDVASNLGSATGVGGQNMGALLASLAPLVLGALGKEKQETGMDIGSLAQMLMGSTQQTAQESGIMGMLSNLFDKDNDGSATDDLLDMGSGWLGGLFGGNKK